MPRKTQKLHLLKRPKFRQSWNKYNLYNLTQIRNPVSPFQTYFQQKWYSKSLTRTYHGIGVKEKHWRRQFKPVVRSVVSMNPSYLANHDGSDESAGRGSGLTGASAYTSRRTPYMNMLYAQMERRLDTAIFRSMFASSLNQARQFCVHGYVKVNGEKMNFPGYNLNPGDMFQVEPERVLLATGAQKTGQERRQERRIARREHRRDVKEAKKAKEKESSESASSDSSDPSTTPKSTLQSLLSQAKTILSDPKSTPSANRKRELRDFTRQIRSTLSSPRALSSGSISPTLLSLASKFSIALPDPSKSTSRTLLQPTRDRQIQTQTLRTSEERMLAAALQEARDNPLDSTKPYATPWRPRAYMSAFAFIPRYLEVHHSVCAAVYLRHPVARAGLGEVPTPFPAEVNGLAWNWYLTRR